MPGRNVSALGGTDGERETLSTGETVELPALLEATVTGGAFAASARGVDALLPDGLSAFRVTPRRSAVGLFAVEYHRVGRRGEIVPYDEFGVVLPAVPDGAPGSSLPLAPAAAGAVGGYIWFLPVTSESARALGVDIWGYPKVVADIAHEDVGSTRITTVTVDGEEFVTLVVDRPRTAKASGTGTSYTVKDGTLLSERVAFEGRVGAWPFSSRASFRLGSHPRAAQLDALDVGDRTLVRFGADARAWLHAGEPAETTHR